MFFHPCNKWFLTNITNKYVRGRHRSLGLWECIEPLCLQNRDWTHVCVYGYQIAILANFRIYIYGSLLKTCVHLRVPSTTCYQAVYKGVYFWNSCTFTGVFLKTVYFYRSPDKRFHKIAPFAQHYGPKLYICRYTLKYKGDFSTFMGGTFDTLICR